ncbi:hypothetical protein JW949_02395 [Candidatus Woesearchaeota archaeon]|nr:hypothetical protein [Candidatus Woesearchaeota archaeon]
MKPIINYKNRGFLNLKSRFLSNKKGVTISMLVKIVLGIAVLLIILYFSGILGDQLNKIVPEFPVEETEEGIMLAHGLPAEMGITFAKVALAMEAEPLEGNEGLPCITSIDLNVNDLTKSYIEVIQFDDYISLVLITDEGKEVGRKKVSNKDFCVIVDDAEAESVYMEMQLLAAEMYGGFKDKPTKLKSSSLEYSEFKAQFENLKEGKAEPLYLPTYNSFEKFIIKPGTNIPFFNPPYIMHYGDTVCMFITNKDSEEFIQDIKIDLGIKVCEKPEITYCNYIDKCSDYSTVLTCIENPCEVNEECLPVFAPEGEYGVMFFQCGTCKDVESCDNYYIFPDKDTEAGTLTRENCINDLCEVREGKDLKCVVNEGRFLVPPDCDLG